MFREMRRKKQILSIDECMEILNKGTSGVLALLGDNNYPYAVPISYVYCNSKLYFHGAKSGHKIDAIKDLVKKYCPNNDETRRNAEIVREWKSFYVNPSYL